MMPGGSRPAGLAAIIQQSIWNTESLPIHLGESGRRVRYGSQAFDSPGYASVHGNGFELGDCEGLKPDRGPLVVRGKDEDSSYDCWTVSENSAGENPHVL